MRKAKPRNIVPDAKQAKQMFLAKSRNEKTFVASNLYEAKKHTSSICFRLSNDP